jgi:tetratricopeptide (TPR) repeat protein
MKKLFYIPFSLAILIIACSDAKQPTTATENPSAIAVDSTLTRLNAKIEKDPYNYKNYLERATYYGSIQNYVDAMKDIDRALVADSTQSEIYLLKGDMHFKMSNEKEAYNDYAYCLQLNSKNTDCLLKKAAIDILLKNYALAIEHINTALKENETLPYAYYLKGRYYKETGDTTLASSSYQTAIEVDPTYYDAYIEVALLYHARKHELAKEYYRSAIDLKPRLIEPWYNLGMFYQETGYKNKNNYKEAFICYDSIISIDKNFAAAHFNKGFIHLEYLQQYDSAIVHFTKSIEAFPKYYQAYYNRGLAYESLEKRKQAESDYRTALNIQPDYSEAALSLDRILKGK